MTANVGTVARLERGLPRDVLAWIAVVVTLAGAVAVAHQGSNSALSIAVATLAGDATNRLRGIGEAIPLGVAFGLGMAAAVNPCGFALLPTYLGLYLGTPTGERIPWPAQVKRALQVSTVMTMSFVALFGVAGLILGFWVRR